MKPWLWLPPQMAHDWSLPALKLYAHLLYHSPTPLTWRPFYWRGLHFANPLGIAGGTDKNARGLTLWPRLGAGFMELGTVTPRPQKANPGRILARDLSHKALWNKMGFPNDGLGTVKNRLCHKTSQFPVFANIGKNRDTSNAQASQDYVECLNKLDSLVDGFVVNVSSPNTQGLRELLEPQAFKKFFYPIASACPDNCPLLVKLSPDLEHEQLVQVLATSLEMGVAGWVLTNTTNKCDNLDFPPGGGVSGAPLGPRAKHFLEQTREFLTKEGVKDQLVISVGGVLTPQDVQERLALGADLVEIYSALIFYGPRFFYDTARWELENRRGATAT